LPFGYPGAVLCSLAQNGRPHGLIFREKVPLRRLTVNPLSTIIPFWFTAVR
jgi:hypothetical protein